jgi:membrane-associated phospholipid phosphatase
MTTKSSTILGRIAATLLLATTSAVALAVSLVEASEAPVPRNSGWLTTSIADVTATASPRDLQAEVAALKNITTKRTADDIARFHWWATGGPAYRWNEIILEEMQEAFVVLPMAARHLALLHAALDDAIGAAQKGLAKDGTKAERGVDAALEAGSRRVSPGPSRHAAAAAAAGNVLAYLFPARAAHIAAMAEEAIQVRLRAGAELPHEIDVGRSIGRKVAALAIARGKADGSDAKWSGTVPVGADHWKGTNPIAPLAGTWRPWVLASVSELRPAEPPVIDSEAVKSALSELKSFQRTPKTNHRALYWEVHGGARAHTLWNEIARTKLLESKADAVTSTRVLSALNIALADAGVACWDAKYAFWYIRPPQLDAELKSLFAPPNHPSYPAAHGCYSTAAATVLAGVFPRDRDKLLALGKEAAEARIWAGIHYRFDIDAGQEIGRKVAERTLERAFAVRTN